MSTPNIHTHFYFEGTFHQKTPHDKQQKMLENLAQWFSVKTKTCCRIFYGTEIGSHKHCHGVITTNGPLNRDITPYKIQQAWFHISKGRIMPTCASFDEGRSKTYLFKKHQPDFTGGCCKRGRCRRKPCEYSLVREDFLKHFID